MTRRSWMSGVGAALLGSALVLDAANGARAFAQAAPGPVAAGPVPAALLRAQKVFVSNAGADSGLFPSPFAGTPARGYNEFYSALSQWGRYQLVDDPAQADVVMELQLIAPNGPTRGSKVYGASDPLPMFRLTIFDRPTHYVLWSFTESVDIAMLQKTHDRNFDDAIMRLVAGLKSLGSLQTPAKP